MAQCFFLRYYFWTTTNIHYFSKLVYTYSCSSTVFVTPSQTMLHLFLFLYSVCHTFIPSQTRVHLFLFFDSVCHTFTNMFVSVLVSLQCLSHIPKNLCICSCFSATYSHTSYLPHTFSCLTFIVFLCCIYFYLLHPITH